ncbi:MAG TPA: VCBS repeat-containing protein, partial [Planctomycetota bacterium]|nr:VCBS repeat-containing protein [Planctomycetota bacterium]
MWPWMVLACAQVSDAKVPVPVASMSQVRTPAGDRLVLITPNGAVLTWGAVPVAAAEGQAPTARDEVFEPSPRGSLELPNPGSTLVCLGNWDIAAQAAPQRFVSSSTLPYPPERAEVLFALGPKGLMAYALQPDGTFASEGQTLARRATFSLRVGVPRFSPLITDVNADGRSDCLVPSTEAVGLWLQHVDDQGARSFERSGEVLVEVAEGAGYDVEDLSQRLSMAFTIPGLNTEDLNGDDRPDLIVEQGSQNSFYLQREDGSYPTQPDVQVDLSIFKDPEATSDSFTPGASLSIRGTADLTRADLNGDGIPDHVISQGRKLWVFPSSKAGPQFTEPSSILRSAEPITGVLVARLDDDSLKDLLLLRVDVPSIPTLMLGLFSSWDISIRASAYKNLGQTKFDTRPSKSSELQLRLPPILDVVRDPYSLLERFRTAGSKFRDRTEGDFNGDGQRDLILLTPERDAIDVYFGRQAISEAFTEEDFEQTLRKELFESTDRVWDVDRLLAFLGGLAAEQERRFTEGRPAAKHLAIELPANAHLVEIRAIDLNGDGTDSALAVFATDLEGRNLQLRLL